MLRQSPPTPRNVGMPLSADTPAPDVVDELGMCVCPSKLVNSREQQAREQCQAVQPAVKAARTLALNKGLPRL